MVNSLLEALSITEECRVVTSADAPYEIRHTNKAWHKLTGYKFAEVANTTNHFLQGPGTEKEALRELRKYVSQEKQCKVKVLNYTKDGQPFYNTIECYPLRDTEGRLTHYCGVLHGEEASNLPKREGAPALPPREPVQKPPPEEEAKPEARRSKRQRGKGPSLAEAIDNSTDAVVLTNPEPPYTITHVNQPWCEMCGYTLEEVEGLTNSILQGPETDMQMVDSLMKSAKRGEPAHATLVNYKNGNVRFVNQLTVRPVYNEDDELEQFMAMLHEVDQTAGTRS